MWRSLLAAVCSGALICGLVGCAEEEAKPPKKTDAPKIDEGVKEAEKAKPDIEKAKEEGKKKVSKIIEDDDEK